MACCLSELEHDACERCRPTEVNVDGTQAWKEEGGMLHREGGLPAVVKADGSQYWVKRGKIHREGGLPAVVKADGTQYWWMHGKRHREGGLPAIVNADGTQEWWVHGKRHREGGLPAVVKADGSQYWYEHGKYHREGGLPAKVRVDGTQEWWVHGKYHREGGLPAIVKLDGTQEWFERGRPYRADGPAVVNADGSQEWWVGWEHVTQEQHAVLMRLRQSEWRRIEAAQRIQLWIRRIWQYRREHANDDCALCLEPLADAPTDCPSNYGRGLCKHTNHTECWQQFWASKLNDDNPLPVNVPCPMCRQNILPMLEGYKL
jgi:hypothetical protein